MKRLYRVEATVFAYVAADDAHTALAKASWALRDEVHDNGVMNPPAVTAVTAVDQIDPAWRGTVPRGADMDLRPCEDYVRGADSEPTPNSRGTL